MNAPFFKGKIGARFPASVQVLPPMTLAKSGLLYTFGIDMNALAASLPPPVLPLWQNVRKVPPAGNYIVPNSDKGTTLCFGGNNVTTAFYQDSSVSAGLYSSDFMQVILNEDQWTGGGHARHIHMTSGALVQDFFLWPGQVKTVFIQNGIWRVMPLYERAQLPGLITFNIDPSGGGPGDDNSNDGLSTATPWKSINGAVNNCLHYFDAASLGAVKLLLKAGATDSTLVHFAPHGFPGGNGSTALEIDLNGGTLNAPFQALYSPVRIRNGTVLDLEAYEDSKVYVEDGVRFKGNTGGSGDQADIYLSTGGYVELQDDYFVDAAGATGLYHIKSVGGRLNANTKPPPAPPGTLIKCRIASARTVSQWVLTAYPGQTRLANVSYRNGADTGPPPFITGQAYISQACHVLDGKTALNGITGITAGVADATTYGVAI